MQIPDSNPPLSQRAYAKLRGVSHVAVQRAVKSGRLKESVKDGKIINKELADQEWAQNTDLTDAPNSVIEQSAHWSEESEGVEQSSDPSIIEANRREKWAKAKLAELKLDREAGVLVRVDEITHGYAAQITGIRNKILGIPSRTKQQFPDLPLTALSVLESLIREALEDISDSEDQE